MSGLMPILIIAISAIAMIQPVTLDSPIANIVTHISGLSNFARLHHGPIITSKFNTNKLQAGSITTRAYTPQSLQKAYGINKLQGLDGSGQTVAITGFYNDPTTENGLNIFSNRYHLPQCTIANGCFTTLNQYGQTSPLPQNAPAGDPSPTEISLDTQSVHSLAPGAKIILVMANTNTVPDQIIMINTIVSNNLAKIIANSWVNIPEEPDSPFEIVLKQGAAQGVSINFASGDYADNKAFTNSVPSVDYPASSSWVTAVGGSSLLMTSDGRYKNETGWAWPFLIMTSGEPNTNQTSYAWGSTGGLSQYYTAQSWQADAIGNVYAGGYGLVGTHRAIPDISMLGDSATGVIIYDNANMNWLSSVGGTSLACPQFSAIIALANQARSQKNLPPIGLVTSLLYNMKYSTHQGNAPITNIVGPHATATSVLTGPAGWNDITGLGSPYAPLFIQALVNSN